jgi:oxygen-dependent protoporphyrinogen oxidase
LQDEVVTAPLGRFVRYVCLNGKLQCIPQSPLKILKAPLVSPMAKLRVVAELWKKPLDGEPTVAQWVEHRLGKALLPFADAVFTGTYAGDIERLVMDGVMPGVRELEKEHGSLIRGLIKRQREKRKKNPGKKSAKKELPAMTSFQNGMERLPQALADRLTENGRKITLECEVSAIQRHDKGWLVTGNKELYRCRHLVLAAQINQCLRLLSTIDDNPAPPLTAVPEAAMCSVLLGFPKSAQVPFGFGYLAPEKEKRFALGALFSSHMFSDRAPQDHVLLEALVGGRRHPEKLQLEDDELISGVLDDLGQLIELPDPPVMAQVLRPSAGIPQLETGYPRLIDWRNQLQQDYKNLHLCGFGWKGIGINDMCKEAHRTAEQILAGVEGVGSVEVKGVYF